MSFIDNDEDVLFSGNGGFECVKLAEVKYVVSHAFRETFHSLFHPVNRRQTSDNEDVFDANRIALVFRHLVNELDHTAGFARLSVADDHLNDDTQVGKQVVDFDSDADLVFV